MAVMELYRSVGLNGASRYKNTTPRAAISEKTMMFLAEHGSYVHPLNTMIGSLSYAVGTNMNVISPSSYWDILCWY